MRWLNRFFRGFNRLWLVVSIVLAVVNAYEANTGAEAAAYLLGTFGFTFVLGHCVFFLVTYVGEWIIRGFR